jgi:hypothetical protein
MAEGSVRAPLGVPVALWALLITQTIAVLTGIWIWSTAVEVRLARVEDEVSLNAVDIGGIEQRDVGRNNEQAQVQRELRARDAQLSERMTRIETRYQTIREALARIESAVGARDEQR